MVEGAEVLPDVVRDAIVAENKEKFLAEDTREREVEVNQENIGVCQGAVGDGGRRR